MKSQLQFRANRICNLQQIAHEIAHKIARVISPKPFIISTSPFPHQSQVYLRAASLQSLISQNLATFKVLQLKLLEGQGFRRHSFIIPRSRNVCFSYVAFKHS
jgi:hypothetical protein